MFLSHLSYEVTSGLFVCLPFESCSFPFFSLPAVSRSSLTVLPPVPGSTAPRIPVCSHPPTTFGSTVLRLHGHPALHRHRPSSRHFALSGESTPQLVPSGSHGSKSRSRDPLGHSTDPPLSLVSFPCLIKRLRAKTCSLCRLGHFGSVLWSIKFFARFLEITTVSLAVPKCLHVLSSL